MSEHVLCPRLYDRLRQLFGSVKIANEGCPINWRPRRDSSGKWTFNIVDGGEYYRVNCFACNDTRHRLWINHMYGQRTCDNKVCLTFLAHCYNDDACMQDVDNRRKLADAVLGFHNPGVRQTVFEVRQPEQPATPRGFESPGMLVPVMNLPAQHPALQYLQSRGYSADMCNHYEIAYCVSASAAFPYVQNKLVFPIRQFGTLVGWQARWVGNPPIGEGKYYTMPGMKKTRIIYNLDNMIGKPFAVVTEGVTDSHRLSDYGGSILGGSVHPFQQQLLDYYWAGRPVVVLLDPEAMEDERDSLMEYKSRRNGPVVLVHLPPGEDPGSLPSDVTWGYIKQAASEANVILY